MKIYSFKIGTVGGVPVTLDVGWLVLYTFVAVMIDSTKPLSAWSPWIGVELALAIAASVLVHEVSHVVVARWRNVKVKGISLHIVGATASFDEEATANGEIVIAFVGPLTSYVLAAIFGLLGWMTLSVSGQSDYLRSEPTTVAIVLATANVVIGTFNALPVFPLDGGRVLHGVLWKLTGKARLSARIAGSLTIGIGMIESIALGMQHLGAIVTSRYALVIILLMAQATNAERQFSNVDAAASKVSTSS